MVERVFAADPATGSGWESNAYLSKHETDAEILVLR